MYVIKTYPDNKPKDIRYVANLDLYSTTRHIDRAYKFKCMRNAREHCKHAGRDWPTWTHEIVKV